MDSNAITTETASSQPSPFMRLPAELRLEIFDWYFALHHGSIKVTPPNHRYASGSISYDLSDSQQYPLCFGAENIGSKAHFFQLRHSFRCPWEIKCGFRTGPADILAVNSFLRNEALAPFLRSFTFRFTSARAIENFLHRHGGNLTDVRSIIIDQDTPDTSIGESALQAWRYDRECMICAAGLFSNLKKLEIHIDGCPWEEKVSKYLTSLGESIFEQFASHTIPTEAIWILDVSEEVSFQSMVSFACNNSVLDEREAYHQLSIIQRCGGCMSGADVATDDIRMRIREFREVQATENVCEPVQWMREGLAMEFLMNRATRSETFDILGKRRFRGIVENERLAL